jgi:acyl-CoA dehydrogenase
MPEAILDVRTSLAHRASQAASVAAQWADDVDDRARFPQEAIDELRATGLLAMAIPTDLGGEGASMAELSEVSRILGEACSATAMIFAMHQIQVLCLTRHGGATTAARDALRSVVEHDSLIASATTELGTGGNTGISSCFVEPVDHDRVLLAKTAPVISYGAHADIILTTARRTAGSAPSDQVLVICPRSSTTLTPIGVWDTLGFRGTCSPGFELLTEVPVDHVLRDDYAAISGQTMVPASHILWASVWLGIAYAATERARVVTIRAARKSIGILPPAATRLAELLAGVAALDAVVHDATRRFDDLADDRTALTAVPNAMSFLHLKITASEAVIDIASKAMLITGIAGYRRDSDVSVGRLLRDSYGTAVMVNNDRILASNAQLSLLTRKKAVR